MPYKTLTLQLYKPSRHKRELLDAALLHYSEALQALLDCCREKVQALAESDAPVSRQEILGLIDKGTAKSLNEYQVQPFKDSLKIEFAAIAASYIAQIRSNRNAGYPSAFLDSTRYRFIISDGIAQLDRGVINRGKLDAICRKAVLRVEKSHSLYFGRYAMERDYCLLYDEFKDRFYAKIYLVNRSEAIQSENWTSGLSLKYVFPNTPAMLNQAGKKRYIILPLAFGKWQYTDLKNALKNPKILHSARLVKKDDKYYLTISMECGAASIHKTATTMGISRNNLEGLNYAVCAADGTVRKKGRISVQTCQSQIIYGLSKKIVKMAADNRSQVILEAKGGKNDRMCAAVEADDCCLSAAQYSLLADVLKYRLPEKRLPPPIEVSANSLFATCPECGCRTQRNWVSDELFVCIKCGYASETEWIGCENLAKRLIKYRSDKIPIMVLKDKENFLFYNKIIGFEFKLPVNTTDFSEMYETLHQFVQSIEGKLGDDLKKHAVWKKLTQTSEIKDAIRLIQK